MSRLQSLDSGIEASPKDATDDDQIMLVIKKKHSKYKVFQINGQGEVITWEPKENMKAFGIVEGFGRHRDLIDLCHCPPKCCHSHGKISRPRFLSRLFKLLIWLSAVGMLLYYLSIRGPELTKSQISTYVLNTLDEVETPNIFVCQPNPSSTFTIEECGLFPSLISDAPPIQDCSLLGQRLNVTTGNDTYECILFQNLQTIKQKSNIIALFGLALSNDSFLYGIAVGLFHPSTIPTPLNLIFTANGFINYIIFQRETLQLETNVSYTYQMSLSTIPGEFTWLQNSSGNIVNGYDSRLIYILLSPNFKETVLTITSKDFFDYLEQFGGAVATIEFWLALLLLFHFIFKQYYNCCHKYHKNTKKARDLHIHSNDNDL